MLKKGSSTFYYFPIHLSCNYGECYQQSNFMLYDWAQNMVRITYVYWYRNIMWHTMFKVYRNIYIFPILICVKVFGKKRNQNSLKSFYFTIINVHILSTEIIKTNNHMKVLQ